MDETLTYHYDSEIEAADPDDAWRQLQGHDPLRVGDVIYVGDFYCELTGDGGWRQIEPGDLTAELYRLATAADRQS